MDLLAYAHPLVATIGLLLAFVVFRDGFAQRRQRVRRRQAPEGSRKRHVKLGPWAVALSVLSLVGGLGSAVVLRDWAPLATFHGKLGVVSVLGFLGLWWMGRQLVAQTGPLAPKHGVLGLFTLFAAGLTGVLGLSLLP